MMSDLLLLSGGMDSTALAYSMRPQLVVTIDYGQQSAAGEMRAASAVAQELDLRHEMMAVDCSALGSGDLAGTEPLTIAPVSEWWPFRNQLLITFAAARALMVGLSRVVIGTVKSDASRHRDGTHLFLAAMDKLLGLQEGQIDVVAPGIDTTSAELITKLRVPRSLLAFSHSCHAAPYACGRCRGCAKHFDVTRELWGDGY